MVRSMMKTSGRGSPDRAASTRLRGWVFGAVVLLCALVVACSGGDDDPDETPTVALTATPSATSTPEGTATRAPSPTPEPTSTPLPRPDANPFPADLREEALSLLQEIAVARGVEEPEPVDMFLLTRDQARDFYDNSNDDDDDDDGDGEDGDDEEGTPTPTPGPRPLDPRQVLYELLGLVPEAEEGTDTPTADEEALNNLISIITGFYAPMYDAFYMIETINGGIYGPLARSTIVHELTHALQYQSVDIDSIAARRGGNFDATTALLSVMEGDAVNSELEILGYSTRSTLRVPTCFEIPPQRNPGTPFAIERELDVWYEDGLCFVQAIAGELENGIADVFENLPTTMEQVLHPEKYLEGERAQPIAPKPLTDALGGDWEQLGEGVFGEFGLQNILLNGLPEDRGRVQEGAAGWGGDAWLLYTSGDDRLLQMETVWDTEEEAPQFIDVLRASLEALGFTSQVEGPTTTLTRDAVTWSVTLRGDSVSVLVTTSPEALTIARETLAQQ